MAALLVIQPLMPIGHVWSREWAAARGTLLSGLTIHLDHSPVLGAVSGWDVVRVVVCMRPEGGRAPATLAVLPRQREGASIAGDK